MDYPSSPGGQEITWIIHHLQVDRREHGLSIISR